MRYIRGFSLKKPDPLKEAWDEVLDKVKGLTALKRRSRNYKLEGHIAVPCDDLDIIPIHVGQTVIGKVNISTIFLHIDHRFGDGSPLLFETMIFGGEHDH